MYGREFFRKGSQWLITNDTKDYQEGLMVRKSQTDECIIPVAMRL